jgi:anion-transporting  ArsA/GET3 family ATPase
VKPRLTILVGAGGVGKTTLAAGLGAALARTGARAALLGIDPARRLRSALGLAEVGELPTRVAVPGGGGSLDAAVLDPSAALRRWVADDCADPELRARLMVNPYFLAIADRLAGLTDAIGCARAAEWAERDPELTDLVLDTAPGIPAVELLARPEKLVALFDGRLVRALVRIARVGGAGVLGHRLLSGLAELSGADLLHDLGALLAAIDGTVATLVVRLERARRWLRQPSTSIVVVCSVNDDAAEVACALDRALAAIGFAPSLAVLNRALPASLVELSAPATAAPASARAFLRYVANRVATQDRVRAQLQRAFRRVIDIPDAPALDAAGRLDGLAQLGAPLLSALDAPLAAVRVVALDR